MKRALSFGLSLLVLTTLFSLNASAASPNKSLATITGSVRDNKGNPVAGALVTLFRDGVKRAIKETFTDAQGNFATKVSPGRYGIKAIAMGFGEVVFSSVEVRASQELIYRFNLEPVGSGNTLPERRRDRDDVKWTLRSAQSRRSIFQAQEGEDPAVEAVIGATDTANNEEIASGENPSERANEVGKVRPRGVIESYVSSSAFTPAYAGLNFAVSTPVSEHVELVFAGQTGVGPYAPERFEATTRVRVGNRHQIGVTAAGARLPSQNWLVHLPNGSDAMGQVSLRAIDEWIVRDGIVIVLGLDYSRFLGHGGDRAVTPRFGVQYDANARTRVRAAFASGADEEGIQSVADFEDGQVIFREQSNRPVAFVDGRAVLERSHRLEFGIERVLDNNSSLEATAFYDTTSGRGVGIFSAPTTAFSGEAGEAMVGVANQQGSSRGLRLVYTRRLNRVWTASAGYSLGRGQRLSANGLANPADMFKSGLFQTAALQLGAGFRTGTQVRTVLRFSPEATVFAIDPFAGRLGVYDPSLSIQVTQELPSFGLPVRAEAVLDARNLLDVQPSSDTGEILTFVGNNRRSVRGGISVRF
ncbi:MAG TPA: TonB-dependent receptor [Pyrinomonadaceae bacterium]|nr:TonB-dependent receptor [Pyrinomonadaceae bacterium]